MNDSANRGRAGRASLTAALLAAAAVGLPAAALAATTVKLGTASTSVGKAMTDSRADTLYVLSGDLPGKLKCASASCLSAWPPLTAPKGSRVVLPSGASGPVKLFRRSNGSYQVEIRGLPVYRFSGDSGKGQVNGQGISSFGGTWHAVGTSRTLTGMAAGGGGGGGYSKGSGY